MTDILLNESNASRRCVPMWCVQSNGTSAATNEAGGIFSWGLGGVSFGTGGTLSAISTPCGLYSANFRASVLSIVGNGGAVNYSSGTVFGATSPFQVVAYDPFTTPVTMPSDPASASAVSAGISAITTQLSLSSATLAVLLTNASLSSATLAVILTNQSLSSATLGVILTNQSLSSATLAVVLANQSNSSATLAVIVSQTSSIASTGAIAQQVLAAAQTSPIHSRVSTINGVIVTGSGTTASPWIPA